MIQQNVRSFVFALCTVLLIEPVNAGDLNPPAGPIAPTMKSLAEVAPRITVNAANTPGDADSLFKISQPGSYILTGNIQGEAAKHGIEIAGSGITLDLNGFSLVGVPGSLDGVTSTVASSTNIVVLNGTARFWGDKGVDLAAATSFNCRVADILAAENTGSGIAMGAASVASDCMAYGNGAQGISAGNAGRILNCTASFNISTGLAVAIGGRVTNSTAYDNDGTGISVGNGSMVIECTARANALDGILAAAGCLIRGNDCTVNGNLGGSGAGIHTTGADNRIEDNNCTAADRGIEVSGAGNIIIKNTCSGNGTNWEIAANNIFGEIVDRTVPGSQGVSGDSAPGELGSSEPNANFSY